MPPAPLPLEPPAGTYDALPDSAARRRATEQRLRELFFRWGYREIITPTLELDEVVRRAGLSLSGRQLYRFVDREGQVLTLRPDWTPAVARLAAARLRGHPLPLRLCYIGSVFRYDRPGPDSPREFVQAGVELLGAEGPLADAEVIALAVEACRCAGVADARVELGHAGYVQALLELLDEPVREQAREGLTRRDLVAFEQAVGRAKLPEPLSQALRALPRQRGGREALQAAAVEGLPEAARQALAGLRKVWDQLQRLGLDSVAAVDLGLVRDLDYYTGVVFEVYAPDFGFSLATGGRYDQLLGRFGVPMAATGFAAGVERLALAAARRGQPPERGLPGVWVLPVPSLQGQGPCQGQGEGPAQGQEPQQEPDEQGLQAAWAVAAQLRRRGVAAAAELVARPWHESLQAAAAQGMGWAVAVDPGEHQRLRAFALPAGKLTAQGAQELLAQARVCTLDELVAWVLAAAGAGFR